MKKEESRFAASTVFEGMTSIRAVLAADKSFNDRRIERVLYDRDRADGHAKELTWLRYRAAEFGFTVEESDGETLDAMTTGQSHGGIVAVCSGRTLPSLPEKLPDSGFYALVEGIEDPYNFGYAIRSLYAAGADGIVLSPRNWMQAAGVVCRSSAGASELLPLFAAEPEDVVRTFRSSGYKIVCAGIRDSVSAWDADLKKPLLLVVGGEKRGISRQMLDAADAIVRLDYGREFQGSLSAASAASILGYEVLRQNRK